MYCTGGIRCEKASAYFNQGFKNVTREGGIKLRQTDKKKKPRK
jgi:predicted sulfurtransferase